jgi:RND family efflux transporter MFP subunit
MLSEEGYPHQGLIDFASISLTPTTGTLQMRGVFSNADGKMMAGTYARLRVPIKEMKALLVPQEAVGLDQRGPFVLVTNARNVVERRYIKMGSLVEHERIVQEGLTREDWVVVRGLQKAFPGRPVTPEKLPALPPVQPESRAPEAPL